MNTIIDFKNLTLLLFLLSFSFCTEQAEKKVQLIEGVDKSAGSGSKTKPKGFPEFLSINFNKFNRLDIFDVFLLNPTSCSNRIDPSRQMSYIL